MFTTPKHDWVRFGIGGDAHFGRRYYGEANYTATEHILDTLYKNKANYYFQVGDLVDLGFDDTMWQDALGMYSPYSLGMPMGFAIGNHDGLFNGRRLHAEYVGSPGYAWNKTTPYWQHIQVNDWCHIFILDVEMQDDYHYTAEQETWFRHEMMDVDPEDWTIILTHAALRESVTNDQFIYKHYSSNPLLIERLAPLMATYDFDMFFGGHSHHLEHMPYEGIDYFVTGMMGGNPARYHSFSSTSPFINALHGCAEVTLTPTLATVRFMSPENVTYYSVDLMP